jgi:hypothetical protein
VGKLAAVEFRGEPEILCVPLQLALHVTDVDCRSNDGSGALDAGQRE